MTDQAADPSENGWKTLYRVGGVAALAAGIIFRRNLGVEIALFIPQNQPAEVAGWFDLLQSNRLLGLAYLNIFDVVNYLLVALMFLALFVLLRQKHPSAMAIAAVLALLGVTIYAATNTALSMLALSDSYGAAAEAQRAPLLAAGQALLALNRFSSPGVHPGSGGFLSLLLVAAAGMIASVVMLRGTSFHRTAAVAGILANGCDLAYCALFIFAPAVDGQHLAVTFIPAAGLFFMAWHIMVGWKLFRLGRVETAQRPLVAQPR